MLTDIRTAAEADAAALARIYNHYVLNTVVTFETAPVDAVEMKARLVQTAADGLPWIVAEDAQGIAGFAYASTWKGRCAYRFSAESTIYLDPARTGRGIGTRLYSELLSRIHGLSLHTVMGGIALPNEPSVRLHERLGFRKVAHFEQVGFKQDRWIDVGYWQLLL